MSTRRIVSIVSALVVVAVLITASFRWLKRPGPPNVVLVTVDTLRPDHLGCYGHPGATTPAIDALAEVSTGFTTAIVPRGQTWPSLATILTSLHPVSHGVRKNGQQLEVDSPTLAEVLAEAGYACFASLSNSGEAGWRGFHEIVDRRDRDREVHQAATGWLRAHANRKFFLWIHYFAPHRPFHPPRKIGLRFTGEYDGVIDGSIEQMNDLMANRVDLSRADLSHLLALYDAEIATVDRRIEELRGTLRELGLERKTLFVFTADHGEELYERNHYLNHSASIYDTVLRVPLLWSWPGVVPEGSWEEGVVQALDIAPTILDLAGVEIPDEFEGRSLAGAIRSRRKRAESGLAFSEIEDRIVSVRTAGYRFIHNPTDFDVPIAGKNSNATYPIERAELYRLDDDPGERVNEAASSPELAGQLRAIVRSWQREHDWDEASARHRAREIPPELLESLQAIGYVE